MKFRSGSEEKVYKFFKDKKIKELKEKLNKAQKRIEIFNDGATHEEMAEGFEFAYDIVNDVAIQALMMLNDEKTS